MEKELPRVMYHPTKHEVLCKTKPQQAELEQDGYVFLPVPPPLPPPPPDPAEARLLAIEARLAALEAKPAPVREAVKPKEK